MAVVLIFGWDVLGKIRFAGRASRTHCWAAPGKTGYSATVLYYEVAFAKDWLRGHADPRVLKSMEAQNARHPVGS